MWDFIFFSFYTRIYILTNLLNPSPHYYTHSQTEALYQSVIALSNITCGFCLHHVPLSLFHCLRYELLCSFFRDSLGLIHAHSLHICSYFMNHHQPMPWTFAFHSKDVHSYSHLAPFCPYSRDLLPVFAHITQPLVLILLVRGIDT